jgi:tetratricopeptide (TPR) repeat protein
MNKFFLGLALLAASLPALSQAQQDQIYTVGGKGIGVKGTVTATSPTEVTLDTSGIPRKFEVKDILKVAYGDDPTGLQTARDRVLKGEYAEALPQLERIDTTKIKVGYVKQDLEFYKALCLAKVALSTGGDRAQPVKLLLDFVRNNRESYHFYQAAETLGDLAVALGNLDKAAQFYGQLASAPWPEYQLKANFLQGQALFAAGKYPDALAKFELVLSSAVSSPDAAEQRMFATAGKGACLAASGKPDEGIKLLEDLIASEDASDERLLARAYNALGACYTKTNRLKDARLAYLHTDLLFGSADPEAHAEALYYLTKLWAGENQVDRAKRCRATLQEDYAGSRWAAMK